MTPATEHSSNLKIFLVDDHDDTRLMWTLLLEMEGHEVHTAGTMHDALHGVPLHGCDVLLSDLGLPDGDGWELLRKLRETGVSPNAIAMSGFGTLADLAASKEAGFRHHLIKPVELDALEGLLNEARLEIEGRR